MPEQTLATPCGLMTTEGAAVPLAGVSIDADVRALGARVTVTQRYHNPEPSPIEAVYVFPLDEGAAVCGFEALIDGVRVVGEVKEREEAFRIYDDAMAAGHGGYLLDEERPDIFQASVGNLPPGAKVELTIVYVVELDVADGAVRFAVPTTVAPRYAPAEDMKGVGRPDADALNPPTMRRIPYGLDLRVRVATPSRPSRVSSPSHPIDVTFDQNAVVVSLSQQGTALDRDFVLTIEGGGFDTPTAWVETSPRGDRAVAVSFVPTFAGTRRPADVVFVVDRSGSMRGQSMREVRNALQLCLRSLTPGCRFNIVGFGTSTDVLFEESRLYDDASLAAASEHVRTLDANLGGTEILAPLQMVFSKRPQKGDVCQVVLLTDGEVTNTDAVLELVSAHASTHRVFTFGIGAGPSAHLVRGIARAGGGSAEFVAPGERIETKVLRLMGRLLTPAMSDVRVTWRGLDAVQAPAAIPPIFAGSRTVVYGFLKGAGHGVVRLEGKGPSGALSFEMPIEAERAVPGLVVSTLAARARIRELEEAPAWLQARGSRQRRSRPTAASQEIVELATRYGLVSRETSYVAIEQREVPVHGDVQLRKVPIALTHGWGATDEEACASALGRPAFALQQDTGAWADLPAPRAGSIGRMSGGRVTLGHLASTAFSRLASSWRREQPAEAGEDALRERVLALVQLQAADGWWDADEDLAAVLGSSVSTLSAVPDDLRGAARSTESGALERAWATALALAWLEVHAARLRAEWQMVAEKGWTALQSLVSDGAAAHWRARAHAVIA